LGTTFRTGRIIAVPSIWSFYEAQSIGSEKPEDKGSPQPRNVHVSIGNTVTLLCPGDNARWTYKLNETSQEKNLYDENPKDNKLTLKHARSNDAGLYFCHYWTPLIGYVKDAFRLGIKMSRGKIMYNEWLSYNNIIMVYICVLIVIKDLEGSSLHLRSSSFLILAFSVWTIYF